MIRSVYFILFLSLFLRGYSQNLVPNGNFEQYSPCPTYLSQISSATSWMQANQGTSDYFNQCATPASMAGVPNNLYGHQFPHGGVAYAGLSPWWQTQANYREYIEVPLDSILSSGACYQFEMYINSSNKCKYSTFEIGAYFSNGNVLSGFSYYLPLTPQINNVPVNTPDTLSWTLVSGTYTAQGGENYLIIGNFKNDQNTSVSLVNNSAVYPGTYCYIDDVSLVRGSCNMQTNVAENNRVETNFYPNPFTNKITLSMNNPGPFEVLIFDIAGHVVIRQNFMASVELNTENLDKGMYFYSVSGKNNLVKKGKLLHE